jgi:rubrerythrin
VKGYCPHEKEKHMSLEKYGVDESVDQDELEKVANNGCPICGKPVTKHGNVLVCPVHGSEPFEKGSHGG